jgi:hypothetical protein
MSPSLVWVVLGVLAALLGLAVLCVVSMIMRGRDEEDR